MRVLRDNNLGDSVIEDVYPKRLPDLFSAKPLFITGRYTGAASGVMRLRGKAAGADFLREINVDLPESEEPHDALASLWARTRIDDLMAQDYGGLQAGNMRKDVEEEITRLGLDYRLMTQFTSFIAVDEVVTAPGEAPQRVEVPVAAPNGTMMIPASGVNNMVIVTSSASTINTSSVEIAATVEHRRLDELPLNMRQPTELAKLAPGAAPT
jgi:Ca-activated chloride channel family protein